ncbi:hypothetical protein BCR37DRAFT_379294 [Protomyces lactucae-debilis]|uniref:NmrA-like domain-containing protein n=1 Tax=Protomyces lactucae-debilis TaxID=2754530 RepID=A0A1Y2FI44_PROLT|nr:uncharacterized protein BCR37DRAFT_379294 [Protomyces lactucae-debilis]ORY83267.1 hypothetical protein BCR37DRAFT_379294 [Protomyces lactucae-debilis]
MPAFTKFVVAGGTGKIGRQISLALLERGFQVTVLSRKETDAELTQKGAKLAIADYSSDSQLTDLLRGSQVVINTLGMESFAADLQTTLAKAAKAAGVQLFVSNDFGVDYDIIQAHDQLDLHAFVQGKADFAQTLKEIGLDSLQFYTGFFDSALAWLFQADTEKRTARIPGTGDRPFAITTEHEVGQFVATAFQNLKEEELRNTTLRFASTVLSPNELFKQVGDYKIEYAPVEDSERAAKDLSLGLESFAGWLRLVIMHGAMSWEGTNDSERIGYKPTDDVFANLR